MVVTLWVIKNWVTLNYVYVILIFFQAIFFCLWHKLVSHFLFIFFKIIKRKVVCVCFCIKRSLILFSKVNLHYSILTFLLKKVFCLNINCSLIFYFAWRGRDHFVKNKIFNFHTSNLFLLYNFCKLLVFYDCKT